MPRLEGPHAGRGPRDWTPGDSRLIEEVSERLMDDRLLDAHEIEVSADGGVVTLEGEVPGASDVAHAEMLVRATPGVTNVRNLLRHDPGPRAVDKLAPRDPPHLEGRWGRWIPPFIT